MVPPAYRTPSCAAAYIAATGEREQSGETSLVESEETCVEERKEEIA
jgi:hypothetical protein